MAKKNKIQTNKFVVIREIHDHLIVLKNGSLRSIIEVNSINFDLKSKDEQTAIISAFQDFLNALDFPMQISILSRKLNIDSYIEGFNSHLEGIENELLKIQAIEYVKFIKGLTDLANIMSKKFYIVVSLYKTDTKASKKGVLSSIKSIFKSSGVIKKIDPEKVDSYKAQMMQRVGLINDGINGIGLTTKLVEGKELIRIFKDLYSA